MISRTRLHAANVVLMFGLASLLFGLPTSAEAWTSPEAAAAAKANPELTSALSKEIGGSQEEAAGAAGLLFGLAKSRLKADEFSQVANAVPGMDAILKAAPSASAAAGGPGDPLSQLAGTVASIPAVASQFKRIGLSPAMAPKAASALVSFVTKSGGAGVGALLAGVLK